MRAMPPTTMTTPPPPSHTHTPLVEDAAPSTRHLASDGLDASDMQEKKHDFTLQMETDLMPIGQGLVEQHGQDERLLPPQEDDTPELPAQSSQAKWNRPKQVPRLSVAQFQADGLDASDSLQKPLGFELHDEHGPSSADHTDSTTPKSTVSVTKPPGGGEGGGDHGLLRVAGTLRFNRLNQDIDNDVRRNARLLHRNAPFYQTDGTINTRHVTHPDDWQTRKGKWNLILYDWWDAGLALNTTWLVILNVLLYTVIILFFAGVYIGIANSCPNPAYDGHWTFQTAFAFSLETATTVGYTLPFDNSVMFFEGCVGWVIAIFFEVIIMIFVNGLTLGIVMVRIQRADRRSNQIIFSNKACVFCLRGRFYLSIQVFDLQAKRPLLNTSVKLISLFHDFDPSHAQNAFWQSRAMRVTRPDDEIGARLWISVPAVVMHEIDAWSPLSPEFLTAAPPIADTVIPNRFPQPPQRAVDGRSGSRTQSLCPVCGTGLPTEAALRRHLAYMAADEAEKGRPVTFGHRAIPTLKATRPVVVVKNLSLSKTGATTMDEFSKITPAEAIAQIKQRFEQRRIEVVVLVEGTDPRTSNSFQARHSYAPEDIAWRQQHAPCVNVGKDGAAEINLSLFHQVVDIGDNLDEPLPFASQT